MAIRKALAVGGLVFLGIMTVVTRGFAARAATAPPPAWVRRMLAQAGDWEPQAADAFAARHNLAMSLGAALPAALGVLVGWPALPVAFLALAGLVLGARIPRTALQRRIDRKRRAIAEQLPEVIDLVAGRSPDDPLLAQRKTRNGLIVELRAICTELGIAYRRVHGLRHSWVTRLLSHGVPLALVQRMAGHRSIATTQQYIDVADGARGWVDRL
jgi:hypothetical protein